MVGGSLKLPKVRSQLGSPKRLDGVTPATKRAEAYPVCMNTTPVVEMTGAKKVA